MITIDGIMTGYEDNNAGILNAAYDELMDRNNCVILSTTSGHEAQTEIATELVTVTSKELAELAFNSGWWIVKGAVSYDLLFKWSKDCNNPPKNSAIHKDLHIFPD